MYDELPGGSKVGKERKGFIFEREPGTWYARVTLQNQFGKRRDLWRKADNKTHAKDLLKQLLRDLVETVKSALGKHALAPECLHVEINANELMQTPEIAKSTLGELRRLGVRIDMDDFGTGHSSLACLQQLPIDVLKIDRSFVANMERSRSFASLVHAVTTLGQNLGLTVVAEGIETAAQHEGQLVLQHAAGGAQFAGIAQPPAQQAGLAIGAAVAELGEVQDDQAQPSDMRRQVLDRIGVGQRHRGPAGPLLPIGKRQGLQDSRPVLFAKQRHRRDP
jgi:hypothetical protein